MPPTGNISNLSDQELAARLREFGVNVGPVVQSTRIFYEKKLHKLVSGEVVRPRYEEVPDDDDEEEEEEEEYEEEDVQEIPVQVRHTRNEPRLRGPTKVTPSRVTRQTEPELSSRSQRPTRSPPSTSKKEERKRGFPIWTVFFILIIFGALGYLIVTNMEPAAENSIPNQIDTEV